MWPSADGGISAVKVWRCHDPPTTPRCDAPSHRNRLSSSTSSPRLPLEAPPFLAHTDSVSGPDTAWNLPRLRPTRPVASPPAVSWISAPAALGARPLLPLLLVRAAVDECRSALAPAASVGLPAGSLSATCARRRSAGGRGGAASKPSATRLRISTAATGVRCRWTTSTSSRR